MSYIAERLTAGSHDIEQTKRILAGALRLARARLEESKVAVPGHWDVDHLLTSPSHSRPFAEVVERTIGEGSRARVLPLAMEVRLFGFAGPETGGADLLRRLRPGYELTSTVLAFATQTLGITPEYLAGPASDITGAKTLTQNVDGKHETTGTVSP
jgi:hypothetical protein